MNNMQMVDAPTIAVINSRNEIFWTRLDPMGQDRITIGRKSEFCDIVVNDTFVSAIHGYITKAGGVYYYEDAGSTNGSRVTSADREVLLDGNSGPVPLHEGGYIRIGMTDRPDKLALIWFAGQKDSQKLKTISLGEKDITIGRDQSCDIVLRSSSVSRFHALISRSAEGTVIQDTSTNGVLVNGESVKGRARLKDKDIIQILGYQMIYTTDCIYYMDTAHGISINARGINKWVGKKEELKQILTDADISIGGNEFVAVIGGSGAGKTTIMNVLNGFDREYEGQVFYNNISLKENFQHLKHLIGYVPQEDIIYENLTLGKMLSYTAKLRMPKDMTEEEREQHIDEVLQTLELTRQKDTFIRKMSGGQKKRASIAVELLADPKLFFLDEPTSGLDPGTEKNLMLSMRKLCKEQERTIIMVTHTTQSLHLCDKIIFMGRGGNVCFVGNVAEAKAYFGTDDLTEIYNIIDKDPEGWAQRNRERAGYREKDNHAGSSESEIGGKPKVSSLNQFMTVMMRYVELMKNDAKRLGMLIIEPLIIGILLVIVANDKVFDTFSDTKSILFTLSCAAIWIGLFNSIQEICKERSILKREYMANLSLFSYLMSKTAVQAALGLVQSILLSVTFLLGAGMFKNAPVFDDEHITEALFGDDPGMPCIYITVILVVWITVIASMALGFVVSSVAKTGDKAMVAAPFILIVQLLFSGMLFQLDGGSKIISYITISKWSVEGLGKICNLENIAAYDPNAIAAEETGEAFTWGSDIPLVLQDMGVMLLIAAICIAISIILLRKVASDGR